MASRNNREDVARRGYKVRASSEAKDHLAGDDTAEHVGRLYGHIYAVVREIPRGRVATYGQVAELAGIPGAARLVGTAMRVSTPELGLPWQRVVGKRSATTGGVSIHDPVGAGIQRAMLEEEGVVLTPAGSISLKRFGWLPER
jgi:methylated-DNA-protein-cysteine methyltransferase-like protein